VDFPEPETPVTATKTCVGIATSISFRLFSEQPISFIGRFGCLLFFGVSIFSIPERYFPVSEFELFSISPGVPFAIISPP
jgi:hypothetical protein